MSEPTQGRMERAGPWASGSSRQIVGGSATYAIAAVVQRGAVLILLPVFTRILSPDEYGQVGVIMTVIAVISTLASVGLETAMLRGLVQAAAVGHDIRPLINSVGGFAIAFSFAMAALLGIYLQGSGPLLGVPGNALQLAGFGAAAASAATVAVMAPLRAESRFSDYLRLSTFGVAVTAALTIVFIVVLRWGVLGWVLGSAIGSLALLIRGLFLLGHRWTLSIDWDALRQALRFGVPLVPHAIAHWGLAVSDRVILGALVASSAIAPYFVAYQACGPIMVCAIAVSQSTQPLFAEAVDSRERRLQLARVSTMQVIVVSMIAAFVALLGPPAIALLLPEAYEPALTFLPWMALGSAFFGFYLIPMNAISLMGGKTGRVWIITLCAAATNAAVNLVFIPVVGPLAAAISTAIGYGVLLIGVSVYMTRVCDPQIPFERSRMAAGALIVGGAAALTLLLTASDTWTGLIVRLVALLAVGAILTRVLFAREARVARELLRPLMRRLAP